MEQVPKLLTAEIIYFGSFLVFPFLILIFYKRRKISSLIFFLIIVLSLLFIWSRFIETQIIITNETEIKTNFNTSIALIADTHLGVYKSESFLQDVVREINNLTVDYVFIAGDFTFEPKTENLEKLFSALSDIEKPIYAVLGNHDVEKPGPKIRQELVEVLKSNNVKIINNEIIQLQNFTLVGLGDAWIEEDNVKTLDTLTLEDRVVVLTHNPDTISKYTNKIPDFTLTGHTHCGQIRIPILYKYVIPTIGDFDKGLSNEENTKLFITCGLGEVGLPMRLFNPPVIDVIKFTS
jgi:predicted MPP superfamily phosphohydrolase